MDMPNPTASQFIFKGIKREQIHNYIPMICY